MFKKILRITGYSLLAAGFLVSLGFAGNQQNKQICKSIKVDIDVESGNSFITENDVLNLVSDKFGKIEGEPLDHINMNLFEKTILNNPYVKNAEVFSSLDGKAEIDVHQRNPVLRICNWQNENFYVDEDGVIMPLSDQFTARVLVASGYIFDKQSEKKIRSVTEENKQDTAFHASLLENIFMLTRFIHADQFWNAQFQQIYVNSDMQIELIPVVGDYKILIGDADHLQEKFDKLMVFYTKGLSRAGWNKYSTINLQYKDQVVCTKK